MDDKRTLFKLSLETQLLIEYLRTQDGFVSYEKLSGICGRDVRHDGRGLLNSARHTILREDRILWIVVPKEGIKPATSQELIGGGGRRIQSINRACRRGAQELACADYQSLSSNDRIKHNAQAAALQTLHAVTQTTSVLKLEKALTNRADSLSIGETLRLFMPAAKDNGEKAK